MQLFARDKNGYTISALKATKRCDYYCMECGTIVRLRAGPHRQPHYFHTILNRTCRLSGKGIIHLQVQLHLQKLLPNDECELEYPFTSIKRIADVVWLPRSIVFEVQCSPITAEEAKARSEDYRKTGFTVVWLLHDKRYNKRRLTAAEIYLQQVPCYYTDIDSKGEGMIYDRFFIPIKGFRCYNLGPLPVDIRSPQMWLPDLHHFSSLRIIQLRSTQWPIFFRRDLADLYTISEQTGCRLPYLERAIEFEQKYASRHKLKLSEWFGNILGTIVRPFRLLIQIMLERSCR